MSITEGPAQSVWRGEAVEILGWFDPPWSEDGPALNAAITNEGTNNTRIPASQSISMDFGLVSGNPVSELTITTTWTPVDVNQLTPTLITDAVFGTVVPTEDTGPTDYAQGILTITATKDGLPVNGKLTVTYAETGGYQDIEWSWSLV